MIGAQHLKRSLWISLSILSVGANVLLLNRLYNRALNSSPELKVISGTPGSGSTLLQGRAFEQGLPTAIHWDDLAGLDFRSLRARLAVLGCPDHTAKAIVEAEIHRHYDPSLRQLAIQNESDFWEARVRAKTRRKLMRTPEQEEVRRQLGSLRQEKEQCLNELSGRRSRDDAYTFAERSPDTTFSFLSEEKRQRIVAQQDFLSQIRSDLRAQRVPEEEINARLEVMRGQQENERSQILSEEELAEYHLRTSKYAHFGDNLYGFEPTPEEFRAIVRLKEKFGEKVPKEEMRSLLGESRAAAYQRSTDRAFQPMFQVANELGLPAGAADEVYALKEQTEGLANSIRANRDLPANQRQDLLRQLHREAEEGLFKQFGQHGRDIYEKIGGAWLESLDQDRK